MSDYLYEDEHFEIDSSHDNANTQRIDQKTSKGHIVEEVEASSNGTKEPLKISRTKTSDGLNQSLKKSDTKNSYSITDGKEDEEA